MASFEMLKIPHLVFEKHCEIFASKSVIYLFHLLVQDMGADEMSECVQDFYQSLSERLLTHFKGTIGYKQ